MSLDEIVKAILEAVKIVAWPAIIFWLAWFLRDEVRRAAARITELGFTGAKFAPPTEQRSTPPTAGVSESAPTLPSGNSPAQLGSAQSLIDRIKASISPDQLDPAVQSVRRDLSTQVGATPEAQIEALTYALASVNVQLAHERNYNAIFGSQLQLLAQMNVGIGVPPNVARQIYDTAKAAYPEVYRTYTFDQWTAFLKDGGLIAVAPNGNYVLTAYGRGFLKYIIDRQLSVNRPA